MKKLFYIMSGVLLIALVFFVTVTIRKNKTLDDRIIILPFDHALVLNINEIGLQSYAYLPFNAVILDKRIKGNEEIKDIELTLKIYDDNKEIIEIPETVSHRVNVFKGGMTVSFQIRVNDELYGNKIELCYDNDIKGIQEGRINIRKEILDYNSQMEPSLSDTSKTDYIISPNTEHEINITLNNEKISNKDIRWKLKRGDPQLRFFREAFREGSEFPSEGIIVNPGEFIEITVENPDTYSIETNSINVFNINGNKAGYDSYRQMCQLPKDMGIVSDIIEGKAINND